MSTTNSMSEPGWATSTWVGLTVGIAASFVFLSISHRPWLGMTAIERLWILGTGIVICLVCLGLSLLGGLWRRAGYASTLFTIGATIVFELAPL